MKATRSRKSKKGRFNSHFAPITWAVLLTLWVVLSGKMDLFHLSAGVLAVIFINWQQTALTPLRKEDDPGFAALRIILYVPWLLWQMFLSSIYVAGIILRDPKGIDPRMITFTSRQPSLVHRVILANSITLTPGTLTVDLKGDRYLVHALTRRTADEVLEGTLARKVARLSPKQPDATPVPVESDPGKETI